MKTSPRRSLLARSIAGFGLVAATLFGQAHAAKSHALILWIGDYGRADLNLPGIDLDARLARQIALKMGVKAENIREISNRNLTAEAIARAFSDLDSRVTQGDQVFVYFSGHGHQTQGSNNQCRESLVGFGPSLYDDEQMKSALERIGRKARQVVMMNDSCFSGGAASAKQTHAGATMSADAPVAGARGKFYTQEVAGSVANPGADYTCGDAVNAKFWRNFNPESIANRPNTVYLAAASAREVAFATPQGSAATVAWHACLSRPSTDRDRSGTITADELQACAQQEVTRMGHRQTLTTVGLADLPLSFQGEGIGATGDRDVSPVAALRDIAATADRSRPVTLAPTLSTFRIGQDDLRFSVTTARPGYLYLLQAGSDGKTLNVIYPNAIDKNHFVPAGTHSFPRQGSTLRLMSRGPMGVSSMLAVIVDQPIELSKFGTEGAGGFRAAVANSAPFRNFVAESARVGDGSYGVSSVVELKEVP